MYSAQIGAAVHNVQIRKQGRYAQCIDGETQHLVSSLMLSPC